MALVCECVQLGIVTRVFQGYDDDDDNWRVEDGCRLFGLRRLPHNKVQNNTHDLPE
jgi:hypothetical protein